MFQRFIPRGLCRAIQRRRAQRILRRCAGVWPIHAGSSRMPEGWPGWPDGKEFAFLLSHDVLGPRGLSRCRELAKVEMAHGFRSAFNFIPDGEYEVPSDLLAWLRDQGFEIGVLNLNPDGRLLASAQSRQREARAINRKLAEWGAVGFRARDMGSRLERLHALNVEYDASAFDVNPFALPAGGVETIFPFWIPKPDPEADAYPRASQRPLPDRPVGGAGAGAGDGGRPGGFVELPRTLATDYTLFVLLREKTANHWEEKLEWIVRHGGMAFLNTHPDYLAPDASRPGTDEYPVTWYNDFLQGVRHRFGSRLYHEVPRVVAQQVRANQTPQARPPREVCMVSFSAYDYDNRVRRYAETLARRGDQVSVLAITATNQTVGEGELNGVRILRLFSPGREERGKLDYIANYFRFGWRAFQVMQSRHFPRGCDLVHVHNMPEALVFAAVCLKRTGAKVILDLHDLMPELYQDKFKLSSRHPVCSLLRVIEGWACQFSDHVIISNHLWKRVVAARSRPDEQLTALINHVDLHIFHRRDRTRTDGKFILLYPGSLSHHQGLDLAIAAMVRVRQEVPVAELHIYGRGSQRAALQRQAADLGLTEAVFFHKDVPFSEIGSVMANADLGLVPKRADGFGNEAFSTKIMEFMSQGLPVVVARTKVDDFYFNDDNVCFFEPGNPADLADKIIALAQCAARREGLVRNADQLIGQTSWQAVQSTYLEMVDRLTRSRVPVLRTTVPQPPGEVDPKPPGVLPAETTPCEEAVSNLRRSRLKPVRSGFLRVAGSRKVLLAPPLPEL